jgi:hypothetical protein
MSKHCYIPITASFKEAHEGTESGCNVFKTLQTNEGQFVISINAVNEFPDLFADRLRFTPLWLSVDEFNTNSNF